MPTNTQPWYRRTLRWGQTNITEIDPPNYDIAWWKTHWKKTAVQGIVANAGGIVAYYQSKFPLQYKPTALGNRDLFGDIVRAAREENLVVLARMDTNRVHDPYFNAHKDWFCIDDKGQPLKVNDLFVACVNGPYYHEYLPALFREIIEKFHPDGFTDNNWNGLQRPAICYCRNCVNTFRDRYGRGLPKKIDWEDESYRHWIEWNYARRVEIWEAHNRVTREAGGPACIWVGMNLSANYQPKYFRDYKQLADRTEMIVLDHQSRADADGFQQNSHTPKLVHGLIGWDKVVAHIMPMYQIGRPMFRLTTKPPAEVQLWMTTGIAGGGHPWWHHIGAYSEDRRRYKTAEPVMRWHQANEQYLLNRKPVASVGLVWSQRNTDFFGRNHPEEFVEQQQRGFINALIRARIPYIPVHIDHVDRDSDKVAVMILPNIGAMSDGQVANIRRFVDKGGHLIATGQTSLYDEWGDPRPDFALADLFGVKGGKPPEDREAQPSADALHTYLRITPELRGQIDGPKWGNEPAVTEKRHPIFAGFDETDLLPFGSELTPLKVNPGAKTLLTFIPAFQTFPPEKAYLRISHTDIPGLVINESGKSRIAFMPAEIDRRFGVHNFPDHGDLLANLVRWAAGDSIPLRVEGAGLVDCELYEQSNRLILHVVNITNAETWRTPSHELIPVGPLKISVRNSKNLKSSTCRLLVSNQLQNMTVDSEWIHLELKSVLDHEVVVFE